MEKQRGKTGGTHFFPLSRSSVVVVFFLHSSRLFLKPHKWLVSGPVNAHCIFCLTFVLSSAFEGQSRPLWNFLTHMGLMGEGGANGYGWKISDLFSQQSQEVAQHNSIVLSY